MEKILFKRKIEEELLEWKNSLKYSKKALLIKGLRQVGKTTIIKKFAYENFENVVYINFKKDLSLKSAFDGDLDPKQIILNLSGRRINDKFVPYKTVLIFDEVQECSGARASIKFFMEEGKYDIIESGSLLGIKGYNKHYKGGVPVGFEHIITMKPMDFEEFLWAKGVNDDALNYLRECFINKKEISKFMHETMLNFYKEYISVGGMPEVVSDFINFSNYFLVRKKQLDILSGFKDDYGKYLDDEENEYLDKRLLVKINEVFDSIPSQLAKENKKFMISHIHKNENLNNYKDAINWLKDYGLIELCYNLNNLSSPLNGFINNDIFKLYVVDSGLFMAMLDSDTISKLLSDDLGIYNGAIFENIAADGFIKNNIPLYYFSKPSGLEIDFIIKYVGDINLVEIKATNGNTKSSKTILNNKEKYPNVNGLIKISKSNIGYTNNILTIPYYLIFLLK